MAMVGTAQLPLVFFVFNNTVFIYNTCKILNSKIVQKVLRLIMSAIPAVHSKKFVLCASGVTGFQFADNLKPEIR